MHSYLSPFSPSDGLRIWNPGYPLSNAGYDTTVALDLWTGVSNGTHIRWDNSGIIEGGANQFNQTARIQGFWFNAQPISSQHKGGFRGKYIFNIDSVEVMRIGTGGNTPGFPNPTTWNVNEGFVRIGEQTVFGGNANAQNRLEIDYKPNTIFSTANGHPAIPLAPLPTGYSGLRLTDLTSGSNPETNPKGIALSVNGSGDVILVEGGTVSNANNGTSLSTIAPINTTVVLGQNVGQAGNPGALINSREIPMNNNNLIFSGPPDAFPGKIGFGIVGGINNAAPLALRPTPITMQVNGSISVFDGTGNTSIFFGENQFAYNSGTLGEWGIHYDTGINGGMNFWKPFGSGGYGVGNRFLFLCDNGNVGIGATNGNPPANALEIKSYPNSPQPAGLRFTNLQNSQGTNPRIPVTNPDANGGVLSVDKNGDVIFVKGAMGGGIGTCNTTPTTFVAGDNGAINLGANNNNFFFIHRLQN